ncbi:MULTISPECIES: helix-turn-helix transcriptional regulator [Bacillus]|uniref:helix-turn-helix transcriptional regulator n=1 Tax=Bacillus TaxID=1386 RepID=UPI000314DD46|nr:MULTISPECIES: helix-turn-helix transcriptional regulator [Bacillus]
MSDQQSRGFLLKQRSFLKLYLLDIIEKQKGYGSQILDELRTEFKPFGYSPTHSELYKTLHELYKDGSVRREKKIKGEAGVDFQEIVIYHLTESGKKEADLYRKQMKVELDRCVGLLNKAIRDHYGPL